jgi:hypothetical protein
MIAQRKNQMRPLRITRVREGFENCAHVQSDLKQQYPFRYPLMVRVFQ